MTDPAGPKARGRMYRVSQLLDEGKNIRDVAELIYGDESAVAQARVRAIRAKIRKAHGTNSSRTTKGWDPRSSPPAVVGPQPAPHAQSQPPATPAQLVEGCAPSTGMVRAPIAGAGSRVGYVLERDVITLVLCDREAAKAVQRLADRVTGAGFSISHQDGVTFQSKGDTVSISEPRGDPEVAAEALRKLLAAAGLGETRVEEILLRVRRPSEISFEELTVDVTDMAAINAIRRCEPYIPEPGRGPYVIPAPSPLIPGLKVYLRSRTELRIELLSHGNAQAFNAFHIRGEFVGGVLPVLDEAPGAFDEWRAQYWHPYSHPIVINLGLGDLLPSRSRSAGSRRTASKKGILYDSLPQEVREVITNLRDAGYVYFNDYRVHLSEKTKRDYRQNPSRLIEEAGYLNQTAKRVLHIVLRKVSVDYEDLVDLFTVESGASILRQPAAMLPEIRDTEEQAR